MVRRAWHCPEVVRRDGLRASQQGLSCTVSTCERAVETSNLLHEADASTACVKMTSQYWRHEDMSGGESARMAGSCWVRLVCRRASQLSTTPQEFDCAQLLALDDGDCTDKSTVVVLEAGKLQVGSGRADVS